MARLTQWVAGEAYVPEEAVCGDTHGYTGEAIRKLAKLEDMIAYLTQSQEQLSAELEKLRAADKMHAYQFRERMGQKLINTQTISLLKSYGLMEAESSVLPPDPV